MTNEEFDAIMEATVKELANQQSWLDKQKENADHIYKLLRELEETQRYLFDLLAVIHHDGGHYREQHGTQKAVTDARDVVCSERAALDEAREALNEAYRECANICVGVAEDIPRDATVWWTAAAQKCCDYIERHAEFLQAQPEAEP